MNYDQVTKELQAGTPAELICATCPWSRPCVTPPSLSTAEYERQMKDAEAKDKAQRASGDKNMPMASLMTALVLGGRDKSATLCPIFVARFTGPDGRRIADGLRDQMQRWGEPS